ncbi:ArgS-related anticodon-binding protein NrtL [Streptomyces sp. LBL]|uniref:ArgS-related anticodon-binding protein NrtL n=1 Tax=Streptomyces sp. LBL TaxID=2940562 RepID=UPI0024751D31|nr:DALR anticodon-binding domain-containing protein [Streptomyces sp. LBL]
MTPVELSRTVLRAVRRAVDEGELRVAVPERVVVTPPGPGGCGDYATNIALQLARPAERTPRFVAEVLRGHLLGADGADGVDDVVISGPGFLNISLRRAASAALVEEILAKGRTYGHADAPSGRVRQLHAAHEVRAVVVADVVARLLRSQGDRVRTSSEVRPEPEWESVLGVRVDAYGSSVDAYGSPVGAYGSPAGACRSSAEPVPIEVDVRPVPAPSDPLPLGRDAGRWALLQPATHDRPRIGAEHLVQRESNPLFRVRYAHARTRALSRNAADLGFHAEPGDVRALRIAAPGEAQAQAPRTAAPCDTPAPPIAETPPTRATLDTPLAPLLTPLADHPRILTLAATHRAPDRLARHLVTVADAVLPFLATVLPRGEEKPSAAHRARLALAEAAGAVLAGGLSLLGIDAPEYL